MNEATIQITDNEAMYKFEKTGERVFFDVIYQRYAQPIREFLRKFTQNDHSADNLTRDVFDFVQRRAGEFKGGSVRAWLYAVAFRFTRGTSC